MRKNRLFWRMFWAFLMTLLLVSTLMSSMMVVMVYDERSSALENEVRVQARDVARLMEQYDLTSIWKRDSALADTLNWKIEEIRKSYGADVWLVSSNRRVWVLGNNAFGEDQLNDTSVLEQIYKVLSGEEIRVQGLIPELGEHTVTIGVPWYDSAGWVGGAVLLHISTDNLTVDFSDTLKSAILATGLALALGVVLAFLISRRQTDPLRQIQLAVVDFSKGKFDRRVQVKGDVEMMELADAFNGMARDLSNLEESRRSFVANVSHELRSPLTCIRGYVEGMLDGTIKPEDREKYLAVVLSEANRLSGLVGKLLDLSRIESGKQPYHPTDFDLCELVRVELIKFEGRIEEKRLDVALDLPEQPLRANADTDSVRQVMINLIDNAVKFAPDGGAIALSACVDGAQCRVSVSNTGDPIPEADLPYVFDRFFKADRAHTTGKGTGLGLSIVQKILEQQGQKIRATSDETRTTFSFTLNRAAQTALTTKGDHP
ncbi:MAG: HAMP domain-containing sensor histidine kinase [Clostridia bacterium]